MRKPEGLRQEQGQAGGEAVSTQGLVAGIFDSYRQVPRFIERTLYCWPQFGQDSSDLADSLGDAQHMLTGGALSNAVTVFA